LGLRADDKAGMMARLRAQGVEGATSLSTFDAAGDQRREGSQNKQLFHPSGSEFVQKGRKNFSQESQFRLG